MSSQYFDQKFLEPQVSQYGGHMVMTNVIKPTKKRYVNLDTKYRDDSGSASSVMDVQFTLPERITNVKSIMACNLELPITFTNISAAQGNHTFIMSYSEGANHVTYNVTLPDGQYSATTILGHIADIIDSDTYMNSIVSCSISTDNRFVFRTTGTGRLTLVFSVHESTGLKDKLGWMMGFRLPRYTVVNGSIAAEMPARIYGPKYLYLVVEDFAKGANTSFISPVYNSVLRKNILAKVTLNPAVYGYGAMMPANLFNGYLLTDRRTYSGKIDLQKLVVQLVDDSGVPVDLRGEDMSLCFEIECE